MGIRLVVIDSHTLGRRGLAELVSGDPRLRLAGEAATAAEGFLRVGHVRPEVALIGSELPDEDCIDLAGRIRGRFPECGVVVMAAIATDELMFRAMDAGASAFVPKSAPERELLGAIHSAAATPAAFTAAGIVEALGRRRSAEVLLSPRERQVLRELVSGHSIATIAKELHVSYSTAKTYTARLYDKLGVGSRVQVLAAALRLGLIRPEEAVRLERSG